MDIREQTFRSYMREKGMLDERYIFCHRGFSVENGYRLMTATIDTLGDQLPTAF